MGETTAGRTRQLHEHLKPRARRRTWGCRACATACAVRQRGAGYSSTDVIPACAGAALPWLPRTASAWPLWLWPWLPLPKGLPLPVCV